jgi:hypothetical protein
MGLLPAAWPWRHGCFSNSKNSGAMTTHNFRQSYFAEFFAYGGQNQNWWSVPTNAQQLKGICVNPGVVKISLEQAFQQRRLYAYVWAMANQDPTANYCAIDCQMSFYRKNDLVFQSPISYALGVMPQQNQFAKSVVSGPLIGGNPTKNSKSLVLFNAQQPVNAFNPESQVALVMHPMELSVECDRMQLDVLKWANMDPNNFRAIIIIEDVA